MCKIVAIEVLARTDRNDVGATNAFEFRSADFSEVRAQLAEEDMLRREPELRAHKLCAPYSFITDDPPTLLNMFKAEITGLGHN